MSLKPQAIGPIPEETARIARAAYPKGNIYLQLRDRLGTIYEDEQCADLFARRGQPAESPWRLALVCVMHFREGLSDRQAADAVRGRLEWKYLLGLELSDPGFDHTVLVEFRQRLLSGKQDLLLFDLLLTRLRDEGYLKARGRQRSDSTHSQSASPRRVLTVRPQQQYQALQAARQRQQRRHSKPRMPRVPGLRGHFHKAFELSDYGKHATADRRKSICSRSSRPPRSISAVCMTGSPSRRVLKHGKLRLFDSSRSELKWLGL